MGLGIAEVGHHAVAEVLGDMAAEAVDRLGCGAMILGDDLAPFLGVEMAAISVEPTRSQKQHRQMPPLAPMTSQFRRDSTAAAENAEALSVLAHSLQNFAPSLLFAPQRGHFAAIGEAHSLQNFALPGFSAEQFWQRIDPPADQTTRTSTIT